MAESPTDRRVVVHMTAEMVKAIDAYWHKNQLRSRAEAARILLEFAISKQPKPPKESND